MNNRFSKIGRFALIAVFMLICVFALASCTQLTDLFNPKPQLTVCVDINKDSVCDTCGKPVTPPQQPECSVHVDQNADGVCDKCSAAVLKNMTGITFTGAPFTYDGTDKKIEVVGAPAGASVTYDIPNVQKNVGEYKITATVTCEGYNPYTVSATMYINAKTIIISWGENLGPFPSNGNAPEIEYTLDGVVDGDEVEVTFNFADCDFTVPGIYEVTAVSANPNYKIRPKEAKTEIIMGVNAHTVTFDTGIEDKTIDPEQVVDGETFDSPRAPSNMGYEFGGWYRGDVEWNFDDPVTESMTLTAKWNPIVYSITYYMNGGENSPENPDTFTVETEKQLEIPTKEGYFFLGWFTDSEFKLPAKAIGTVRSNLSLYAKWSSYKYTESVIGETLDSESSSIVLSSLATNGTFSYTVVAKINEFGDDGIIRLGRGKNTVDGTYVEITYNKAYVYTNGIDGNPIVQSRGFARDFIGYVVIDVTVSGGSATITITTAEGASTITGIDWAGRNGEIFVSAENASLENLSFGWYTNAYDNLVWIVGDSDVGSNELGSWTAKLNKYKFDDYLAIGANGLESAEVLELFKESTEIAKPLFAIWSFAKENGAEYEANLAAFLAFCEEKGITPVLTTHPNYSNVDNTAKNAVVKASGERYIDFADVTVYPGVISDDKYTDTGAETLFAKFMTDFPEIIGAKAPIRTNETELLESVELTESAVLPEGTLTLSPNAIKDSKHLVFTAKIDGQLSAGQKIVIGHGYMQSTSQWIEINNTAVDINAHRSWTDPKVSTRSYTHGLNIKNYITVIISVDAAESNKRITLFTDGGSKVIGATCDGNIGQIFAAASGINLTDAKLTWVCKDYAKDIWVIGDSYLSLGDPARWPTHLYNDAYYNALMIGRSGMRSAEGLAEFKDALQYDSPKYLLWCMGMNDGDDNGMIDKSYLACVTEVFALCEQYDIIPVIATIPTCPAADNGPKNDAINNKTEIFADYDYRIIDFARAVNGYVPHYAEPVWYENMLHTDDVHPALLGAKALYLQLITDFPEIIYGWNANVYNVEEEELSRGETITVSHTEVLGTHKVFTFSADFLGNFTGSIEIGNGKNVDGGTWLKIQDETVTVYKNENGEAKVVATVDNKILMKDLINLRIHVKGDVANVSFMSAGEKKYNVDDKRVFNFDVEWSSKGDVFVTPIGLDLEEVSLNWFTS